MAKETFTRIDSCVWSMLWRWAVRRHPNKSARWVKQKYFKSKGTRQWVFTATEKQEEGINKELVLVKEADTPIKRHVKIKAQANPHDPEWDSYFESRWNGKVWGTAKSRSKLYRLWFKLEGICADCKETIIIDSRWAARHIVIPAEGGTDAMSNLEIHHLHCKHSVQSPIKQK